MRPRHLVILTLALTGLLTLAAQATTTSAQDILAASDAVRNPEYPFGVTNTLIEYHSGKQTSSSTLTVYSRVDAHSGQFRSLVRFAAPARDAGKLMLYGGRDLWFYDPASKASVRLSPRQRLLGQASNGDVVTVNLALDYLASHAGEEDVLDGERVTRHCHRLDLAARTPEASYHHIEIWIDTGNLQPVKARFLAESGKLLKTAYFRYYRRQLGARRPTETVIIDGLDPSWVTVMRFSDWVKREVPEAWLQRDYLPQFHPE